MHGQIPVDESESSSRGKVADVRVCQYAGSAGRAKYRACKESYAALAPGAVQEAMKKATPGDPASELRAIQEGLAKAMAAAVEESAASSGGGGDGAGRRGSGLTGRERAAHWLDQLRDREAALGATPAEAPKTLDAWRDLLVVP